MESLIEENNQKMVLIWKIVDIGWKTKLYHKISAKKLFQVNNQIMKFTHTHTQTLIIATPMYL